MRSSRGASGSGASFGSPGNKQPQVVSSPPVRKTSSWVLQALVIVGLAASVFVLIALRHFILRDDFRLSFRATTASKASSESPAAPEEYVGEATPVLRVTERDLRNDAATVGDAVADERQAKEEREAEKETEKKRAAEAAAATATALKRQSEAAKAAAALKKQSDAAKAAAALKRQSDAAKAAAALKKPSEAAKQETSASAPRLLFRKALYAADVEYSGLYRADGEHESYSGAWLAPRRRLFDSWERINRTSNLEGSTMAVSGYGRQQDPRITLMSRDFFDFQVLHLSVTTNFVDSVSRGGGDRSISDKLFARVTMQMTSTVSELEHGAEMHSVDERLHSRTVAIIPFTGFSASTDKNEFQSNIRKLYFKATFYSVHRYIRTIIVSVPSQNDYEVLRQMNLPIWKILNFASRYMPSVNMEHPRSPVRLPKHTLQHVIRQMHDNPAFRPFDYVYYSEGDLVLHLRSEKQLLDALDASGGTFAASPHRLQSNPLPKTYTPEMQTLWDRSSPHKFHKISLANVDLVTEDGYLPKGTCCDNGRFDFRDCGNWWYYCPKWGLNNFTTWVRFGEHGFTLPLGTEHRARCTYSPVRKTCPMPATCKSRLPTNARTVCGEMPNVERTYIG